MKSEPKHESKQEQLQLELDQKINQIDNKLDVLAVQNNKKTKVWKTANSVAANLNYAFEKTKKWAKQNDFSERSKDYFNLIFKLIMQFSNNLVDHDNKIKELDKSSKE